jgi:hypothetical protein
MRPRRAVQRFDQIAAMLPRQRRATALAELST